MTWSSTAPVGGISVRSNLTVIGNNTTYIENTMGGALNPNADHFWNIGVNEDGRHRKVAMRNQGSPLPVTLLPPTFDGVYYVNNTPDPAVPTARFATTTKDYQLSFWENVSTGTFTSAAGTNTPFTLTPVLANQFGLIQIFCTVGSTQLAMEGNWLSKSTNARAWSAKNSAGILANIPTIAFAMPIELDFSGSAGLFIKGIIPSGFGLGPYTNTLFSYILYTRASF